VIESFAAMHSTETGHYSGIASDGAHDNVLELSIDRTLKPRSAPDADSREFGSA